MKKTVIFKNKIYKNYEVDSITGNVYRKGKSEPLKRSDDQRGYDMIDLSENGFKTKAKVHLIVAHTFIGPQKEGMVVEHLDGNKKNCALANLKYGTYQSNTRHAQLFIRNIPYLDIKTLDRIDKMKKMGESIKSISEALNLNYHVVRDYLYGKTYKR